MGWSNNAGGWRSEGWSRPASGGGGAYTGPGDIATAFMWGGLRAYSAAAIGSNAVRLVRASDSAQQDFVTLSDGTLDIASITTFLAATTGKVVTLYDQTGNSRHLTQSNDTKRPAFTFSVIGSRPMMRFLIANGTVLSTAGTHASTQPITHSMVLSRTATSSMGLLWWGGSPDCFVQFTAANTVRESAGTNLDYASWTNNQFQSAQFTFNNTSSTITVNGSVVAGPAAAGTGAPSGGNTIILGDHSFGAFFTGDIGEYGIFQSTGPALSANQKSYWGY